MEIVKRSRPALPNLLSDFFDAERFFGSNFFNNRDINVPAVNIKERDNNFQIELAAPGFKKEDIKLDLEENVLTISAERQAEKSEEQNDYTRREFSYNSFSRSFSLPENSNADKIEGEYKDGIVRISLPKKENGKTAAKKHISLK
jgi:HSP20 family protein